MITIEGRDLEKETCKLVQEVWETEDMPASSKESLIVYPIYKKGEKAIALLDIVCGGPNFLLGGRATTEAVAKKSFGRKSDKLCLSPGKQEGYIEKEIECTGLPQWKRRMAYSWTEPLKPDRETGHIIVVVVTQ
ncbi:hypothetical protein ILUMI_13340 [Ignelater luminosus]|uniref:Uncharacterized protein n=1 Tax=Ignelater luminosus TaxID=2038154 RepID=A0A8K0GBI7_IGNLU|nr:hypothetical protein ILUMI_13340 [Ignelater luminosus]